tara:strand:+ start:947 stop:1321 length:375 start_codon:yes stop_codon:yes gene_type:complete
MVPQEQAGRIHPYAHQHGRMAITVQEARRARHRHVCHHWRTAKRLSHAVSLTDLLAWFVHMPTTQIMNASALLRLHWLLDLRHSFNRQNSTPHAILKVNAAVWGEINLIKEKKRRARQKEFPEG